MSNPMEGRKMDPKLAKILAEHAVPQQKQPEKDVANDPSLSDKTSAEPKRDLFAEMYPLLTKKLRRGKSGGTAQR